MDLLEDERLEKANVNKVALNPDKVNNRLFYHFFKRSFDIVISGVASIGVIIIIPIVGIAIKSQNKGPIIYKQIRIGKNGKPFKMYKFRSMIMNAEEKLKNDPNLYKKYVAAGYKFPEGQDPRVTKIGRWLRKTSLDELPQFFNVLKGDMSMVGPRPIVKEELSEYGTRKDKFLSVKPGVFGLWQANGRSNIKYPERCDIELEYVDNASIGYDLKIFFKTIKSIIKKDGAF